MNTHTEGYGRLKTQKQYLKLTAANIVGRFGDSLDAIVFSWVMYQVTDSAPLVALIFALNFVPNILFQPFAGALVEHFPKKKIMVACDAGRAVLVTCTGGLLFAGVLNAPLLIAVTLCNSTLECFRMPAGAAIVPKILDADCYSTGVAFNQTASRVAEIVGKAAAGGIVGLLGSSTALFLDAAAFLISGGITVFIRCKEERGAEKLNAKTYFGGFLDGLRYIRSNRFFLMILLLGAFMNFAGSPLDAFQAVYVGDSLKLGPEMLSLFSVLMTGGMAAGSVFCPYLRRKLSGRMQVCLFGALTSVCIASFWIFPQWGEMASIIGASASFLLLGIGNGVINVVFNTALLTSVNPDFMARVSSISTAALLCTMPLGSFLCSALATVLPVPVILLGGGLLGILVYILFPRVKVFEQL